MKAVVYRRYGPPEVLALTEVAVPAIADDEVLVKIHAAAVNPRDWHFMTGTPFIARLAAGPLGPKHPILGVDISGTVEAVGRGAGRFQPGDEVFGATDHGAFAEYARAREVDLAPKPAAVPHEAAAALPASGSTALQALRDHGRIRAGQRVLINGASGGIGTLAVQIAKANGTEVTGVCSSRNLDLVRSLGADHVVDYTREDFTRSDRRYDVIFDTVGKRTFDDCRRVLTAAGVHVTTTFSPGLALRAWWVSVTGTQRLVPMFAEKSPADLVVLHDLLEKGRLKAVIDRCVPLSETPEALRHIGGRHARGKIVIHMPQGLEREGR